MITISDHNNHQNQSLIPLSDFSLHIHSPPFAVSAHTLQSPTYTSSCPSPVPSCYCPADGCAAAVDVWFHSGKVEMFVHVVKNAVFLWFVGNHVTFGIPNQILRDTEIGLFERGTVMGTRGWMVAPSNKGSSNCRRELNFQYTSDAVGYMWNAYKLWLTNQGVGRGRGTRRPVRGCEDKIGDGYNKKWFVNVSLNDLWNLRISRAILKWIDSG